MVIGNNGRPDLGKHPHELVASVRRYLPPSRRPIQATLLGKQTAHFINALSNTDGCFRLRFLRFLSRLGLGLFQRLIPS